jgi:trk system potassium uptake protein TrkA
MVENIEYIEISRNIGIDTIINKKLIAASFIIRQSMGDEFTSLKCISGINVEIVELIAKAGSTVTKVPIRDLKAPDGALIGGIIRGDESFIALGSFQIKEGDRVVIFALPGVTPKVEKLFHKEHSIFTLK